MGNPKIYDFVVIGDTNIDYHVRFPLHFSFSNLIENGVIYWENIDELIGGSGLNFLLFAQKQGYSTLLVSNIGNDPAGGIIKNEIDKLNINVIKGFVKEGYATGKSVIVRDSSNIRLLVNNSENANHELSFDDIKDYYQSILNSKILYISGYSISNVFSKRHKTVVKLLENIFTCKTNKPFIILDVVPHKIYEQFSFSDFYKIASKIDLLISEVSTLRRFFNLGNKNELIDDKTVEETILSAKKYFKNLILRFGPSGCDEQIIWSNDRGIIAHDTTNHFLAEDKRGFGDKIAIEAIQKYFSIFP